MQKIDNSVDVNSVRMLVSSILMHTVGPQVLFILPAFVQGLVDYGGLDEKSAGFLASAETSGIAAGTIAIILTQSKINWRYIFTGGLLLVVASNIASVIVDISNLEVFRVLRAISGFGAGLLLSLSYVTIGLSKKHDRNFGLMIMTTLVYAAVLFVLMPTIYDTFGFNGLLIYIAVSCALGLFFVKDLPTSGKTDAAASGAQVPISLGYKIMGLASIHTYFIAVGVVWSYMFLVGTAGGGSEQEIANAFTMSQFAGMAGAFGAAMIATRFGRTVPLVVAVAVIVGSLLILLEPKQALMFSILLFVWYFAQNTSHPFLLGALASFDRSGKLLAYASTLTSLGYAFGPALAAKVIPGDNTYDEALLLASGLFTLALLLILIPIAVHKRNREDLEAAGETGLAG